MQSEMQLNDELLSKLLDTPDGVTISLTLVIKQLNSKIEEMSKKLDSILIDHVSIETYRELKEDFELYKRDSENKIRILEDLKIKIYAYAALLPIGMAILIKVWK